MSMLIKPITYKGFFGEGMITKNFYFNLTTAEWLKMEVNELGFKRLLERLMETQDHKEMLDTFENLILKGYGERIGDDFVKSEEALARFRSSNAYSVLFMELFTDDKKAIEFLRQMLPEEMMNESPLSPPEVPTTTSVIPPPPLPQATVDAGRAIANEAGM
jgi:hypothetical protein